MAITDGVMEELRKAFKEFDVNEDGSISKEELATVMKVWTLLLLGKILSDK